MTPQERDLITALLSRLKEQGGQPKDAEAEALIRRAMAEQPDAPYLLVQTVLIQDMALHNAQARIAELERQTEDAKGAAAPSQTSFLGGTGRASVPSAGPWGRAASPPPQGAPGPVWTQSGAAAPPPPQPGYPGTGYAPGYGQPMMGPLTAPSATSGFLRQAATTAAGVAGGALLFEGIQSLFGHHAYGGMLGGMPMQPGLSETVINNYYGDQGGARDDAGWQQADLGRDYGGQQDYAADPGLGGSQDYAADQDLGGSADYASDQDFGGNDDTV